MAREFSAATVVLAATLGDKPSIYTGAEMVENYGAFRRSALEPLPAPENW